MKIQSLSTLVALASAVQLAAANGWLDAQPFQCPGNSDNHCSPEQGSGFDWTGLPTGNFGQFGGLDFNGWQCSDSFAPGGKRSINERAFQSKCITGVSSSEGSDNPSFGCGSGSSVPNFSVDTLQVTSEFHCNLDFHYGMPDGSVCKQTSPCSSSGSTIKNTQCGGAKNVTVVYPGGGPKPTCSIGVHSIGFDCSSHSIHSYTATTVPQQSTPSSYVQTHPTTTAVSSPATTTSPVSSPSTPTSIPVSSPSTPVSSPSLVTSTIYTTSVQTITSCAATVTNCPGHSTVLTTVTVAVSTTVCPVTATQSPTVPVSTPQSVPTSQVIYPNSTFSAPSSVYSISSGSPISTPGGITVPASSPTVPGYSITSPSSSASPLPYPSILPQCLNTWIPMLSNCTSNTQYDCYCPSENLVCSVYDCLYAHGASSSDISSAQNYFKGICVNQIDSNPAILSCSSQVTGPTTYPTGPVTTVTVKSTVVVPCSESGTVIPSSYSTTVVTTSVVVPQVVLTTVPGPVSTVALVTGSPAPATPGAQTVPATQTTLASVPAPTNPGNSSITPTPTPVTGSGSRSGLEFSCFIAASIFLAVFAL